MDGNENGAGLYGRRKLLGTIAFAGAAAALGVGRQAFAIEPPPETKRIRLPRVNVTCWAPAYVAEDLLKAEGFSEVQLVSYTDASRQYSGLAAGEIDIMMSFVAPSIHRIDAGDPLVVLGGVHPGCIELIASPQIRSVLDLKGRVVAVSSPNSPCDGARRPARARPRARLNLHLHAPETVLARREFGYTERSRFANAHPHHATC
jgi:NitT/TauT family transport system substrate-binding protein